MLQSKCQRVFIQSLFARVLRGIPSMLALLLLLLPTNAVPCEIARYMYLPMIAVWEVAGSYAWVGRQENWFLSAGCGMD